MLANILANIVVTGSVTLVLIEAAFAAWRTVLAARGRCTEAENGSNIPRPPHEALRISVVIPAFNEQSSIVRTVWAACAADYPGPLEVIVVNDGSRDGTIDILKRAFALQPVRRAAATCCPSRKIAALYSATVDGIEVLVADKENGGKADALNAGINLATGTHVCVIDADTLLEPDAISVLARAIAAGKNVVAVGGVIGVTNGHLGGRWNRLDMRPRSGLLVALQAVEYARAFAVWRLAASRLGLLTLISGAFGIFRRELLLEIRGYSRDTVGEDYELVVRIHRHMIESSKPYQVRFVPNAMAWTEVPDTVGGLAVQRSRWQRGALQTLFRHRDMLVCRRYGWVGLIGIGSIAAGDVVAPLLHLLLGPTAILAGCAADIVTWSFAVGFTALQILAALAADVHALCTFGKISPKSAQPSIDAGRLLVLSVLESLVYRNMLLLFRVYGTWHQLTRPRAWGRIARRGFQS